MHAPELNNVAFSSSLVCLSFPLVQSVHIWLKLIMSKEEVAGRLKIGACPEVEYYAAAIISSLFI